MKRRPMFRPPRADEPEIFRALWLASGPGRAWQWGRWARGIKPGDRLYALAQDVRGPVTKIMRWYRKGASDYATLLLERLDAKLKGRIHERGRTARKSAEGGAKAARSKQARAADWQRRIEPQVRRYLAAGKTDSNIAALVADDVERAPETVRRFIARLRAKLQK